MTGASSNAKNGDIAQKQLDAYNAQDLAAYVSYFSEDCVVAPFHGAPTEIGRDAIRARYAKAFESFPENKAVLKNRIVVGDTVVDHELVIRKPGGEQFEVIAIYSFRDGQIARVNFAK